MTRRLIADCETGQTLPVTALDEPSRSMKFGVLNAPSTFNSHPDSAVSQPRKGSGLSLDLGDEILEMRSRWREVVERVVHDPVTPHEVVRYCGLCEKQKTQAVPGFSSSSGGGI